MDSFEFHHKERVISLHTFIPATGEYAGIKETVIPPGGGLPNGCFMEDPRASENCRYNFLLRRLEYSGDAGETYFIDAANNKICIDTAKPLPEKPSPIAGHKLVYSEGGYHLLEDNTGITVYHKDRSQPSYEIEELGPIPDDYTHLKPGDFDEWAGSGWVKNSEIEVAANDSKIRRDREVRLRSVDAALNQYRADQMAPQNMRSKANLTSSQVDEILAYRKQLLDITEAEGYPFVSLPEAPACVLKHSVYLSRATVANSLGNNPKIIKDPNTGYIRVASTLFCPGELEYTESDFDNPELAGMHHITREELQKPEFLESLKALDIVIRHQDISVHNYGDGIVPDGQIADAWWSEEEDAVVGILLIKDAGAIELIENKELWGGSLQYNSKMIKKDGKIYQENLMPEHWALTNVPRDERVRLKNEKPIGREQKNMAKNEADSTKKKR